MFNKNEKKFIQEAREKLKDKDLEEGKSIKYWWKIHSKDYQRDIMEIDAERSKNAKKAVHRT